MVARLREWPGVHLIHAVEDDGVLKGYWFDRTQEYAARRRREKPGPLQYATPEELVLSPLPCWKHLPPEEYKRRLLKMRDEIEAEAAAARAKTCRGSQLSPGPRLFARQARSLQKRVDEPVQRHMGEVRSEQALGAHGDNAPNEARHSDKHLDFERKLGVNRAEGDA